jgi:hypothetical protein
MTDLHSLAAHHVPIFITSPGETDVLFVAMAVVLIGAVLGIGVFFFWLHSLPERMVHNKVQFDIVAVLALLSLFTHQHAFWVAALLIALIDFQRFSIPDFSGLLERIASSLEARAPNPAEVASLRRSQKKKARATTAKDMAISTVEPTDITALPHNKAQTEQSKPGSANGRPRKQRR